ncbi:hypothetical protein [Bacillus seohaeanensis]|uniref:Uncharacterized protein n=1 Tax=Bacillus seohaeanensis TaxID=284580 RepID=A0ABW5RXM0_9BACI
MSLALIEKRIDRLEKLNEELIRKLARVNVANYYLSQRIETLEEHASVEKAPDISNQQKKLSLVSN